MLSLTVIHATLVEGKESKFDCTVPCIAFIVETQLDKILLMFTVTKGVVSHIQHDLISKEMHL